MQELEEDLSTCVLGTRSVAYKGRSICIHQQLTPDYQVSLKAHITWMKLHGMWLIVDSFPNPSK